MKNKKKGIVIILVLIVGFIFGLFYVGKAPNIVGYTIVDFEVDENWDISNGVIKLSQGDYVETLNAGDYLEEGNIIIDLGSFELASDQDTYVDLIIGEELVDSKKILAFQDVMGVVEVNDSNVSKVEDIIVDNFIEENDTNLTEVVEIDEVVEEENITNITEIVIEEIEPEEIIQEINETNVTEETTLGEIVSVKGIITINQPVVFLKEIKLEKEEYGYSVDIPSQAKIISIKKIDQEKEEEIKDKVKVKEGEVITELTKSNLITGGVIVNIGNGFLSWLRKGVTGFVVKEDGSVGSVELIIEDSVKEFEIEYELPGPVSREETISEYNKKVIIGSDIHYENILAYSEITEDSVMNSINLYRIIEGQKIPWNFDQFDVDGNGMVDKIKWVVPSLSEEEYEILLSESEVGVQSEGVIERTANKDIIINAEGGLTTIYNPGVVNFPLEDGTFLPFEEVVNVSIVNGEVLMEYGQYKLGFSPIFVMQDGTQYNYEEIPPSITKSLWKEERRGFYKYGADFSNVPNNIKDNVQYISLHRGTVENLDTNDLVVINGTIIIKDKIQFDYGDILEGYNVPIMNKTDIVIGGLENNWVDNGDGTWNISFDPVIQFITNSTYEGINFFAVNMQLSDSPPPANDIFPGAAHGPSSSTTDGNLDSSNNGYAQVSPSANGEWYQGFVIYMDEDPDTVTELSWLWEGKSFSAALRHYGYLWNFTSGAWVLCWGPYTRTSDVDRICTTTDTQDYIDTRGRTIFLTYWENTDGASSRSGGTDFIRLNLTHTGCGYTGKTAIKTYSSLPEYQGTQFSVYYVQNLNDEPPPSNVLNPGSETDNTANIDYDIDDDVMNSLDMDIQGSDSESYVAFNATIDETPDQITMLNWTWRGTGWQSGSIQRYGYMWNFSSSSWYNCFGSSTTVIRESCAITEGIWDFNNSDGEVWFMAYFSNENAGSNGFSYTDWGKLEVTLADPIYEDWSLNCAYNCNVLKNVDAAGGDLIASGTGYISVYSEIDVNKAYFMPGCKFYTFPGGKIW